MKSNNLFPEDDYSRARCFYLDHEHNWE